MLTRSKAKKLGKVEKGDEIVKRKTSNEVDTNAVKKPRGRPRGRVKGIKRKATKEPSVPANKNVAKNVPKESKSEALSEAKAATSADLISSPVPADVPSEHKDGETEKPKPKKKPRGHVLEAAIRPRKQEEGTFYLRDLRIVLTQSEEHKPTHCVECVNFYKEDIFGHGGENINKGFQGFPCMYLVPVWTNQKELANVTGFELAVSNVEDPSRQNLYMGVPGMFVYLVPTFNPAVQDRIIGLQLFRSRNYNPPKFGWSNTTININEGRGGDHLCLQWDLGNEQDIPGHRFRFRFWRR